MKKLILLFLLIPQLLFAQEQITDLHLDIKEPKSQESQEIVSWTKESIISLITEYNKSLPILNEELRKAGSGIHLPPGAVFFMITGSCPSGSTDVTSTYSNKFIRINATGGSTGGVDTHTHAVDPPDTTSGWMQNRTQEASFVGAENSDNKHNHQVDIASFTSGSGDNVPAYVTCKLCQVN